MLLLMQCLVMLLFLCLVSVLASLRLYINLLTCYCWFDSSPLLQELSGNKFLALLVSQSTDILLPSDDLAVLCA